MPTLLSGFLPRWDGSELWAIFHPYQSFLSVTPGCPQPTSFPFGAWSPWLSERLLAPVPPPAHGPAPSHGPPLATMKRGAVWRPPAATSQSAVSMGWRRECHSRLRDNKGDVAEPVTACLVQGTAGRPCWTLLSHQVPLRTSGRSTRSTPRFGKRLPSANRSGASVSWGRHCGCSHSGARWPLSPALHASLLGTQGGGGAEASEVSREGSREVRVITRAS